jgi:hypothetical protein
MRSLQYTWQGSSWSPEAPSPDGAAALVLVFGPRERLTPEALATIHATFPGAVIVGCSTAGEIAGTNVHDDAIVITAVEFDSSHVMAAALDIPEAGSAFDVGARLASSLEREGLAHVFLFSDGTHVNGSELVRGVESRLPEGVGLTGGLAADGSRFERTSVVVGAEARERCVAALGFYGARMRVGFGSFGGWDPFGPERRVTRSSGNLLWELEGQSALELYEAYLGEHAARLPSSALLFPLSIRQSNGSIVVRTVLGIDREAQSMTFAGDIPEGSHARLMKANFDRLIDGAHTAASATREHGGGGAPDLAILVSCVGRKLVLGQRIEEELDCVREVLGASTVMAGFYSYGEISSAAPSATCELHNQTMTITTITER